jgi:hypothetical protein
MPPHDIFQAITAMVRFFLPQCTDQSTMRELEQMAMDHRKCRQAHKVFDRIRTKNLKAIAARDKRLEHQYSFEEICAKTLYNLADHHEGFSSEYLPPFDEDSPFWVVPIAVQFAKHLGLKGVPWGSDVLSLEKP